ncbi:MAG: TIGR02996 domain-containing protein [Archangium sp.]|nr:TIGR02996 domain-containing protein [Archangium sp.]
MAENEALLKLCLEKPNELERLLVYTDWLEEQGDPRAPYTRAQLEMRRAPEKEQKVHRAKLRSLYPIEHAAWCSRFEQVGVFGANLLEVPDLWWGVGLGERETGATYQGFAYAQQPPLPVERFDGSFEWLARAPTRTTYREEQEDTLWAPKIASLRERGFNVPTAFETLMLNADLQLRVPSCTDNTFLSGKRGDEHPLDDPHETFLTFYTDSQSCVLWGIRLARGDDRYAPVLAGAPEFPEEEPPEGQPYFRFPELTFNAPTFETFVYRWWLENTLWFATQFKKRPLNAEEQAYMDHLAAKTK